MGFIVGPDRATHGGIAPVPGSRTGCAGSGCGARKVPRCARC